MKLLIITQSVDENNPTLGFFCRWVEEFSKKFEQITVICLEKGMYTLPPNVSVYSLGKEEGASKLIYIVRFYSYILKHRHNYDSVFVHMNPEYVVLGGLIWKLFKKNILLWYTHRAVTIMLRVAYVLADMIATAAQESFNIDGEKVHVVGHGIDTQLFTPADTNVPSNDIITLLHVGRITPIKRLETLIDTLALLGPRYRLILVGEPISEADKEYEKRLQAIIESKKLDQFVSFAGSFPQKELVVYYRNAQATVNLAPRGGIDKTVLEALSTGVPTFVTNDAFRPIYGTHWNDFSFQEDNALDLKNKITSFFDRSYEQRQVVIEGLSKRIQTSCSVEAIVEKLAILLKNGKTG